MAETLSAAQAARRLGVKPATLYTYVSRGWLQSLPGPRARERRYRADEVEALRARSAAGKGHGAVAADALGWGQPVVETAVGTIAAGGPVYRGVPASDLVSAGFAAACGHLWAPPAPASAWQPPCPVLGAAAPGAVLADAPLPGLLAHVARRGLETPLDEQVEGAALSAAAVRLIWSCAGALGARGGPSIGAALAQGWGRPRAAADLEAALVLCADHGLNASTFAARVAASTGAGLHAVVCAGLAALSGPRHGGASLAIQALVDAVAAAGAAGAATVLARHRAQGRPLPGLGHRLYPEGDPRARALLARAADRGGPGWAPVSATLVAAAALGHPPPDLDFGLVGLARAWALPRGAPGALFALGRLAGWVAHLHEERARGQLIRPRARYVGPPVAAGG